MERTRITEDDVSRWARVLGRAELPVLRTPPPRKAILIKRILAFRHDLDRAASAGTAEVMELGRTRLEQFCAEHLADLDPPAITNVVLGRPFLEIVGYAEENEIDLIVMGTHGRGAIAHVLLGSTTEKVIRKAPCAVLTVRPSGHECDVS